MALAPVAERVDGAFLADRGDDVLQQPSLGGMVEDVAERHRADTRRPGERGEIVEPQGIVGPAAEGEAAIAARAEGRAQFGEMPAVTASASPGSRIAISPSLPRDDSLQPSVQPPLPARALPSVSSRVSPRPGGLVGRVEQQRTAVVEIDPGAAIIRTPVAFCASHPRTSPATLPRSTIPSACDLAARLRRRVRRAGGAAQEREMARHLKFDIGHHQPNSPWRYQLRSPVAGSTPSPRRNSQKRAPVSSSTRK